MTGPSYMPRPPDHPPPYLLEGGPVRTIPSPPYLLEGGPVRTT
jgi:hypothetical protein